MTSEFKALLLRSRQETYTHLSGHNLSKHHGEGYDFAELREYQIGDDIRKINWTITAKLGKPYVKELHANRELYISVAALMDGSLYSQEGNDKQRTMTEVAAILGYAAQYNHDLFQGICFSQDHTYATPPTKQLFEIERFCQKLYDTPLLHTSLPLQPALDALFLRLHRPSLLFILHDFLEPMDLSLLAQRHEVIAIVIRHPEEENPRLQGELTLHNPQTAQRIDTYISKRSITRYIQKRVESDERMVAHFSEHRIRYVKIMTTESVIGKLLTLFR